MLAESRITSSVDTTVSRLFHCCSQFHRTVWVVFVFAALTTAPCFTLATALDDYVAAPDGSYSFSLVRTVARSGYTEYRLDMTSQRWRPDSVVNRMLWEHRLIIVVPETVSSSVALLRIAGGNNGQDLSAEFFERDWALNTNTVVASLRQVPNQPLVFTGDGRSRREDEILAFTFAKFMDTGDETWPTLLPMVKSAVRAMDTVQTFVAEETAGAIQIEKFVVTGASKRGWTTWLTAAVDPRVEAIIPVVFDVLNIREQVQHHRRVYEGVTQRIVGGYAEAVRDYVDENVLDRFPMPEGQALLEIIDPYNYRDRLTLPKFMINAAGDEFFVPDSAQFYFDDLVGPKYLRYVPNAGHGDLHQSGDWANSLQISYESVLRGSPLPEFAWTIEKEGSIRVETVTAPVEVKQWQATNPRARDFRMNTLGPRWRSSPLADQGGGIYTGRVADPQSGYTAFFVELKFESGGQIPYTFTTEVSLIELLPCDTHCRGVSAGLIQMPEANVRVTVDAQDDTGDTINYSLQARHGLTTTVTAGPQTENVFDLNLTTPGNWTITVTVDDGSLCDPPPPDGQCVTTIKVPSPFLRGDSDSNGTVELTDGIVTLTFLFVDSTKMPACFDAADTDDDGALSITDGIRVLQWLFVDPNQAPLPPSPRPGLAQYEKRDCGLDPSMEDPDLGCETPSMTCQ